RFYGICVRAANDEITPLLITKHPPPVRDGIHTVRDESRASDGCEACEEFLQSLYGHLPTPCAPVDIPRGCGVLIEDLSENPSNTSHPSLVQTLDLTDTSHPSLARKNGVAPMQSPVTEPPSEGCPVVGDCPRCG